MEGTFAAQIGELDAGSDQHAKLLEVLAFASRYCCYVHGDGEKNETKNTLRTDVTTVCARESQRR